MGCKVWFPRVSLLKLGMVPQREIAVLTSQRRRYALVTMIAVLVTSALGVPAAGAARPKRLDDDQLILLREAMQLVRAVGDDVWVGWAGIPKTTLIIAPDREYLVNLPRESESPPNFVLTDQKFMGEPVYSRQRTLSSALRAAFPIGGVPVAVIGAWRADVESPNEWVVGLVEQWFHLLQLYRGEQAKVAELGLGASHQPSWQINFSFPFDDPDVGNAMLLLGQSLYDFWTTGASLPRAAQRAFLAATASAALQNLRVVITLKHGKQAYEYFRLQTWRTGVARYSSILAARAVARAEVLDEYKCAAGFDRLERHKSYAALWEEDLSRRFWLIRTAGLEGERDRMSFDALGHGIAELLDVLGFDWKKSYFDSGVWLDDLVATGMAQDISDTPKRASARRQNH